MNPFRAMSAAPKVQPFTSLSGLKLALCEKPCCPSLSLDIHQVKSVSPKVSTNSNVSSLSVRRDRGVIRPSFPDTSEFPMQNVSSLLQRWSYSKTRIKIELHFWTWTRPCLVRCTSAWPWSKSKVSLHFGRMAVRICQWWKEESPLLRYPTI